MQQDTMAAPTHSLWHTTRARTLRQGQIWIPGERESVKGKTYQHGPMYVLRTLNRSAMHQHDGERLCDRLPHFPAWLDTPDGRPGWAQRLVEAGYPVFVIDRPGHGRSPYQPDVMGPIGDSFPYEEGSGSFRSCESCSAAYAVAVRSPRTPRPSMHSLRHSVRFLRIWRSLNAWMLTGSRVYSPLSDRRSSLRIRHQARIVGRCRPAAESRESRSHGRTP